MDPFVRFAEVSGADDPVACAAEARALCAGRRGADPFADAVDVKRQLVRHGFRDDAAAFTLPVMLARRGGNCLGLTLLIGAALLDRGHEVGFVIRLDPFDDVHDAGVEYFARLRDPDRGVDQDSRLPDAGDRTARFRFAPVEHASLLVGGRPFEATGLGPVDVDSGWAPDAERVRVVDFVALAATVLADRARALGAPRAALRLALGAVRAWPGHREAWADVWRLARRLGRAGLASVAEARYLAAGGDDSLYWLTRYRMTGDVACLDRALTRLPSYAEAYVERHVVGPLAAAAPAGELSEIRRHLAIAAWMVAGSEVLDLERFYRERADAVTRAFSAAELADLLASFAAGERDGADSRT